LKKKIALLWLTLIFCLCGITALADNLIINGSFEELDEEGFPVGWETSSYFAPTGYTLYTVEEEGADGVRSVSIENFDLNDARFEQTVAVEPESLYHLSGYIRTRDVQDAGWGANLSVYNITDSSEGVYETNDEWRRVDFYGETGPEQTEVTVYVRLGGYSGESQGYAQFDNITLEKIDAVPEDVIASLWYRENRPVYSAPVPVEEDSEYPLPGWFWWTLCLGAYALIIWLARPALSAGENDLTRSEERRSSLWLAAGLGGAFVLRILIALWVPAYEVDMSCFRSWGGTMRFYGPGEFYAKCGFCDYPPGYLYILGLIAHMLDWFGIHSQTYIEIMYKMGPIAFDLAGAVLLYAVGKKWHPKAAVACGMLYLLNPAVVINSAAWGQVDSVLSFMLVLVVLLAAQKNWLAALPVFALAALTKPQALMMGPLGLCAFVLDWVKGRGEGKAFHLRMLASMGLCLLTVLAVTLPFNGGRVWPVWLIELYGETLASYAEPTVNAANLYYLLGQNWGDLDALAPLWVSLSLAAACGAMAVFAWIKREKAQLFSWLESAVYAVSFVGLLILALVGCSYSLLGAALMVLAFLIVIQQFLRSGKTEDLPLHGGNLLLLLYAFGVKMHERYLFPALLLWTVAYALRRDRRILWLMVGSTATLFLNIGIILDKSLRLAPEQAHLNVGAPGWEGALAAINILLALFCVYVGRQISRGEKPWQIPQPKAFSAETDKKESLLHVSDHRLHMKAKDYIIIAAAVIIYSVIALWNLGSTKAPQTTWKSTAANEQVVLDLGERIDFKTLYYCQVSRSNFSVAVSDDGLGWSEEYPAEMAEGQCYRWKYLMQSDGTVANAAFSSEPQVLTGRYVRISAQQIGLKLNEMIFKDLEGNRLTPAVVGTLGGNTAFGPLSDAQLIIDEQDTLVGEPSWYNGTYFDEIYHARTAYEHAHAWDDDAVFPYETSHPPLGKVIMSWFVMLFGMTPFGWRFAGALMGILMLPAMYLLVKQLFKRTDLACAAMLLMAFDLMHLTQTRIATIDSFPVLFIILAFFFMLRFTQVDPWSNPLRTSLWPLFGSGVCMGLAIASKWIGVYAGIGLAVIYFWTVVRHLMEHAKARKIDLCEIAEQRREAVRFAADKGFETVVFKCLWCCLFFIVIPFVIYYCSYIPYFASTGGVTVEKVIEAAIGRVNEYGVRSGGMLGYHSTPGLGMDHPYYSPWWEWPLIIKPMYYAASNPSLLPEGMDYSIFCMGNPAVWWVGLAGLIYVAFSFVKRHVYLTAPVQGRIRVHPRKRDHSYAFLLLAFAAQFLPWVLVPRGTYIYHYFASVPFIICCSVMMIDSVGEVWGKRLLWLHVVISGCMFVLFYPYASGEMVSVEWLEAPKALMNWARYQENIPGWLYDALTWFPKIYY